MIASLLLLTIPWVVLGAYSPSNHLWYQSPGSDFNTAIPLGNGRLGALLYGSASETILLNEHSVWSKQWQPRVNENALQTYHDIRDKLVAGNLSDANAQILRDMSANPVSPASYSVTNSMHIDFGHDESGIENYERWLDLQGGTAGVSYEYDGVAYRRELVASFPSGVIALRFTSQETGRLHLNISLSRDHGITDHTATSEGSVSQITLKAGGSGTDSLAFTAVARVVADDGNITADGQSMVVSGSTTVDIFYNAESEYHWGSSDQYTAEANRKIDAAAALGFETVKSRAVADQATLMKRVYMDLGSGGNVSSLPTDQRIERFKDHPDDDNGLIALFFNFGRHLLVSSSRDVGEVGKGVPANLQGIWNENFAPPWGSKYTININFEMNYWLADLTNLGETLRPFWDLVHRTQEKGRDVAQAMYGCPGFVTHSNTDLWGDAAPADNGTQYTIWPVSQLWLLSHTMEHYRFTGDEDFLREVVWPLLLDAADFLYCYLFDYDGHWVTGPSTSPEHRFRIPADMRNAGDSAGADIAPTGDTELVHSLFSDIIEAAGVLGITGINVTKAESYRDNLRPIEVGSGGQLTEWRRDYQSLEPNHKHLTPLWGLYPGTQLTPAVNATLSTASRISLENRITAQGGLEGANTGWSRAWNAACFARLFDGDTAFKIVQVLIQKHALPNGFQEHEGPPFQIDSNFGLVAAVGEMFVQSHNGVIHLLPALSSAIPSGSIGGLRARGAFQIDVAWKDGKLTEARIRSDKGSPLKVLVTGSSNITIDGEPVNELTETSVGHTYIVRERV